MIYGIAGLVLSLALAAAAWLRSRARGGFYDRETYGMDARAHRRYAMLALLFAAFFTIALMLRASAAGIAALALYAVVAVFYAASFLRGASDAD